MKAQEAEEQKQEEEQQQQQQVVAQVPTQGGGQGETNTGEREYPDFPQGEDLSEGKSESQEVEQPKNSFQPDVDTPDNQMQPSNKHGENTNQGYGRPSIETVTTQESFDEAASGLADRAATEVKYATFPKQVNHEEIIVPANLIWKVAELSLIHI